MGKGVRDMFVWNNLQRVMSGTEAYCPVTFWQKMQHIQNVCCRVDQGTKC